ncbi:hypothetical protein Phum_PHUM174490 [Pediculus humanus corporis]|uniref:PAZ domain-containing protein n=1 Tax=Pediculus humanus subsp. corporis TaxID=121224 RepID=E0VG66_PEDHC|nr:uncharacterized protein Phum_PHUM174490 [Pediculus humanus corporis]EEB12372.1 hypothetical protein Phum_PHUM174490 [Pediculus humanus corporis]
MIPSEGIRGKMLWKVDNNDNNSKANFVLTEATFTNFVISPSYRNICPPQYYVVSSVCHNMSPLSPFPREEFEDFRSYYRVKYDAEITNLEQPLLKVSRLPNCLNFNKPRINDNKSMDKFSFLDQSRLLTHNS